MPRDPQARPAATEPVAIVGMGVKFPGGAESAAGFADLLREGRSGIRATPEDRWDVEAFRATGPEDKGQITPEAGGFLDRIDEFDAPFFNISAEGSPVHRSPAADGPGDRLAGAGARGHRPGAAAPRQRRRLHRSDVVRLRARPRRAALRGSRRPPRRRHHAVPDLRPAVVLPRVARPQRERGHRLFLVAERTAHGRTGPALGRMRTSRCAAASTRCTTRGSW